MLSDLDAQDRRRAAVTAEEHLAVDWSREGDRSRHERTRHGRPATRPAGVRHLA